ncbi:MAG TPA: hypothetical protein VFZ61_12360 [Polyangiales bacterium]
MNLERLEQLARTPRAIDHCLTKVRERPMFFMRSAVQTWEREMRSAPLVFAYVVQAEPALFEPGCGGSGRAVLLHSQEPGYIRNAAWLAQLADRVRSLRTIRTADRELLELGMLLIDEQSEFSLPVPLSLTRLILARLSAQSLDVTHLPAGCVPRDRIVPALALPKLLLPLPAELWT